MAKIDYPELEGQKVDYFDRNGIKFEGIVTGCNFDIGLSVQSKDDPNLYLLCITGKSAPNYMQCIKEYQTKREKLDKIRFYSAVAKIKKGYYDDAFDDKIASIVLNRKYTPLNFQNPTANDCPFNQ